MNTSEHTKKVAHQFCQALAERKLDLLLPLFSQTIDWYIPGNEKVAPWKRWPDRKIQTSRRQLCRDGCFAAVGYYLKSLCY